MHWLSVIMVSVDTEMFIGQARSQSLQLMQLAARRRTLNNLTLLDSPSRAP